MAGQLYLSPFNTLRWQIGDTYYYAAWVREVLEGTIPPSNPTASEQANIHSIEIMKSAAFILAALPGFFIEDFRFAYIVSYGLFPSLSVFVGYFISREFTENRYLAALIAFSMIFFYMLLMASGTEIHRLSWLSENFVLPDAIGSFFRYVNSSVAFFIILLFTLQLLCLARYGSYLKTRCIFLVISGIAVGFAYIPLAIAAYLFMASYAVFLFFFGLREAALKLLGCGIAIFSLLILSTIKSGGRDT